MGEILCTSSLDIERPAFGTQLPIDQFTARGFENAGFENENN